MNILAIIIFIGFISWIVFDYKKVKKEQSRCPRCNQITKNKFSWKSSETPISTPGNHRGKFNATVYKCPNCGFSWNHTYESDENAY